MVRDRWLSLNGLWDYSIVSFGEQPTEWQGEILVPFCAESSLSGVGRKVGKEYHLWYGRSFIVPSSWSKERIILHFGAVDWECDIWVNDIKVCSHQGGYTPFSADITDALVKGSNTLKVEYGILQMPVGSPEASRWPNQGYLVHLGDRYLANSLVGARTCESHITRVTPLPILIKVFSGGSLTFQLQ